MSNGTTAMSEESVGFARSVYSATFFEVAGFEYRETRAQALLASVVLMTSEEVDLIRKIQLADEEG